MWRNIFATVWIKMTLTRVCLATATKTSEWTAWNLDFKGPFRNRRIKIRYDDYDLWTESNILTYRIAVGG